MPWWNSVHIVSSPYWSPDHPAMDCNTQRCLEIQRRNSLASYVAAQLSTLDKLFLSFHHWKCQYFNSGFLMELNKGITFLLMNMYVLHTQEIRNYDPACIAEMVVIGSRQVLYHISIYWPYKCHCTMLE